MTWFSHSSTDLSSKKHVSYQLSSIIERKKQASCKDVLQAKRTPFLHPSCVGFGLQTSYHTLLSKTWKLCVILIPVPAIGRNYIDPPTSSFDGYICSLLILPKKSNIKNPWPSFETSTCYFTSEKKINIAAATRKYVGADCHLNSSLLYIIIMG